METKFDFTKRSISEFENWIANFKVARTVLYLQQHHTWSPNYTLFDGNNHFELQKSMKDYHVHHNGWMDIGQHFTIFPDGSIITGRSLEVSPACILGNNANAICIENLGNFDIDKDVMTTQQRDGIIRATAAICKKFSIPVNTDKIVYHHWFNLSTGERNNGTQNNKSCPGTNFFGGNTVEACQANFLPLVLEALNGDIETDTSSILKYVTVTSDTLNIRKQPKYNSDKVPDREPATFGAVLRVYQVKNGWLKISDSKNHWVSERYTREVIRAAVNADALNVRNGPGKEFMKVSSLKKGEEVFIFGQQDDWCQVSMEDKWVKASFLDF